MICLEGTEEGSGRGLIEVISRRRPRRGVENHTKPLSGYWCPSRDSSQAPPENKSRTLYVLDQPVPYIKRDPKIFDPVSEFAEKQDSQREKKDILETENY
jgi:hypothetical protein